LIFVLFINNSDSYFHELGLIVFLPQIEKIYTDYLIILIFFLADLLRLFAIARVVDFRKSTNPKNSLPFYLPISI
jgi:hypothetical protein